jgi:hypothetical protein
LNWSVKTTDFANSSAACCSSSFSTPLCLPWGPV